MGVEVNPDPSFLEADTAAFADHPATMGCAFTASTATFFDPLMAVVDQSSSAIGLFMAAAGSISGDPVRISHNIGQAVETTTGYSIDTHHFALGSFATDADRSVYIDGRSKTNNTSARTGLSGLDRTSIGRYGDSSPTTVGDNVGISWGVIWSVILNDEEAEAHGKGAWPFHIRPDKITNWWPLPRKPDYQDLVGGVNLAEIGTVTSVESPLLATPFMAA